MMSKYWGAGCLLSAAAVVAILAMGCGPTEKQGEKKPDPTQAGGGPAAKQDQPAESKHGDHSGWWCDEHGVPEKECSQCDEDVAKACKAKGDWCEKHNRAKSQCFLCDPGLKEKYAARYRVKYGKEPPPVKEGGEEPPKKDSKE